MEYLKQSTAATIKLGPFLDETNGRTAETALTISQADIRISKNGGAFAQTNNAAGATHDENGWYGVPLNVTDTATLGRLKIAIHESEALPCFAEFMVVTANVYDSLCSTDKLEVDLKQILGTALTETAGYIAAGFKKLFNVATPLLVASEVMRGTDDAALASILKEVNQSLNGAKCIIDRAASTFKVYDTDGTTLLFTITKSTSGNVDTLTRT